MKLTLCDEELVEIRKKSTVQAHNLCMYVYWRSLNVLCQPWSFIATGISRTNFDQLFHVISVVVLLDNFVV